MPVPRLSMQVPAGLQATLQTMTDPNAAGGANVFLGTLVLGFSAANGALTANVFLGTLVLGFSAVNGALSAWPEP